MEHKEKLNALNKQWKKTIDHFSQSGLSQVKYCQQYNLIAHQFYYWREKFSKKESKQLSPLIRVTAKTEVNGKGDRLGHDSLPDPTWVAKLIKAIYEIH